MNDMTTWGELYRLPAGTTIEAPSRLRARRVDAFDWVVSGISRRVDTTELLTFGKRWRVREDGA